MVYVVKGQLESLLGKKVGEALGLIKIDEEGDAPTEKVMKMLTIKKENTVNEGGVSDGETQAQIDKNMEKLVAEYQELFSGVGEAKMDPIHIYVKENVQPVAQRQRPVALNYMEPLKRHLDELLDEGIIEGPLGSD